MRPTRNRLLGAAVVPVLGLGLTLGCAGCGKKSEPGVATAVNQPSQPAAAGSNRPASWAAYDKAMADYVACLQQHGLPDARYDGHKDSAKGLEDELSGTPDFSKGLHPAVTACRAKQPHRTDRPEPYAQPTMSAADLAQARQYAKCIREHGFPDYPDPDPDPQHAASNKYSDNKAGQNPKLDEAGKLCAKQVGIPEEPDGGLG